MSREIFLAAARVHAGRAITALMGRFWCIHYSGRAAVESGAEQEADLALAWLALAEPEKMICFTSYGASDLFAWVQQERACVMCPECSFTFSVEHQNEDGSFTCPLCELELEKTKLAKACDVALVAIGHIPKKDYERTISELREALDKL